MSQDRIAVVVPDWLFVGTVSFRAEYLLYVLSLMLQHCCVACFTA